MASRGRSLADRIVTYFGDNQPGIGRGIEINNLAQFQAIGVDDIADLNIVLSELESSGLLRFPVGTNVQTARTQLAIGHLSPMALTLAGWSRYEQL
jgi:hypothetical protein